MVGNWACKVKAERTARTKPRAAWRRQFTERWKQLWVVFILYSLFLTFLPPAWRLATSQTKWRTGGLQKNVASDKDMASPSGPFAVVR